MQAAKRSALDTSLGMCCVSDLPPIDASQHSHRPYAYTAWVVAHFFFFFFAFVCVSLSVFLYIWWRYFIISKISNDFWLIWKKRKKKNSTRVIKLIARRILIYYIFFELKKKKKKKKKIRRLHYFIRLKDKLAKYSRFK